MCRRSLLIVWVIPLLLAMPHYVLAEDCDATLSISAESGATERDLSSTPSYGYIYFNIDRTGSTDAAVSFDYVFYPGTAETGEDFRTGGGSESWTAGQTNRRFGVKIYGDDFWEGDEEFYVDLENVVGACVDAGRAVGSIRENESVPQLWIGPGEVLEGDEDIEYQVQLHLRPIAEPAVTFDYLLAGSSATGGEDFTADSGSFSFPSMTDTASFPVTIIGDDELEGYEQLSLGVTNLQNATLPYGDTLSILDDEQPRITITGFSVTETDGDRFTADYTLNLSHASHAPVTVRYATTSVTAREGTDFADSAGTASFAPGEVETTVPITIIPDTIDEADSEILALELWYPINGWIWNEATLLPRISGRAYILDDDAMPTLLLTEAGSTDSEGDGGAGPIQVLNFDYELSEASGRDVSFDYTTVDGTALASEDYRADDGRITIRAGTTTGQVRVWVSGDTKDEPAETFYFAVSEPSAVNLDVTQVSGTITDDDDPPSVSIGDASAKEDTEQLQFEVTLAAASGFTATVDWATAEGTALETEDFTADDGTVTFAPGETVKIVTITLADDERFEANDIFTVVLSNPVKATLGDAEANGTIENDDSRSRFSAPTVYIPERSGDTAWSISLAITLQPASEEQTSVGVYTEDYSAFGGEDYQSAGRTVTLEAGETQAFFEVTIYGDNLVEEDESFRIRLADPVNALIESDGWVLIENDDFVWPDLTITKTHEDDAVVGDEFAYDLVVSNLGDGPTTGLVTVVDELPDGLDFSGFEGEQWDCEADGATVSCTTSQTVAADADATALAIWVDVSEAAYPEITNTAQVETTGDSSDDNDDASDVTTVYRESDLEPDEGDVGDVAEADPADMGPDVTADATPDTTVDTTIDTDPVEDGDTNETPDADEAPDASVDATEDGSAEITPDGGESDVGGDSPDRSGGDGQGLSDIAGADSRGGVSTVEEAATSGSSSDDSGCGCTVNNSGAWSVLWLLPMLWLVRSRRRRHCDNRTASS